MLCLSVCGFGGGGGLDPGPEVSCFRLKSSPSRIIHVCGDDEELTIVGVGVSGGVWPAAKVSQVLPSLALLWPRLEGILGLLGRLRRGIIPPCVLDQARRTTTIAASQSF